MQVRKRLWTKGLRSSGAREIAHAQPHQVKECLNLKAVLWLPLEVENKTLKGFKSQILIREHLDQILSRKDQANKKKGEAIKEEDLVANL
jgi:hypothetical protein